MFALVVVAAFGSSIPVLILTAGIIYMPGASASRARSPSTSTRWTTSPSRGARRRRLLHRSGEILPNMIGPMLTDFGLRFVFIVLLLSGLSFLGLGVQPPNADWGSLVRENIGGLPEGAPAVLMPSLAIATLTIGVNLLIDNLPGAPQPVGRRLRCGRSSRSPAFRSARATAPDASAHRQGRELHRREGEVLALIGESGSGKTTIALALLGYARPGCRIAGGRCASARSRCCRYPGPSSRSARAARLLRRAERGGVVQPGAHDHGPGDRARAAPRPELPRGGGERRSSCSARSRCPSRRRSASAIRTRSRAGSCSG